MHAQFMGGQSVAGGTTYGTVDCPGRPSMAAKLAVDGPGGPILGGPLVA